VIKILIVEDEPNLARLVTLELQHEGYEVEFAHDGREGLNKALSNAYDLILLDVMLPSVSGLEILRKLRQTSTVPVIMISARDATVDKISGLDLGADDYLTKPFDIEELLARIRANLKRGSRLNAGAMTYGQLIVDPLMHSVKYKGETVDLTKKEFDLLSYLLNNRNIVLSREKILSNVWGYDFVGNTNVVDVYIRYLRAKIDDKYGVAIINTVRGSGYMIKD